MASLSTHVLDTARGIPAEGVAIGLEREEKSGWKPLAQGRSNADGRCADLVKEGLSKGVYRLTFDTAAYFKKQGTSCFFPSVGIIFEVSDDRHHHVPLLLSPFGYSTYRGS